MAAIGIERLRVSVMERFRSLRNYLFALNVSCPPTSTVERRWRIFFTSPRSFLPFRFVFAAPSPWSVEKLKIGDITLYTRVQTSRTRMAADGVWEVHLTYTANMNTCSRNNDWKVEQQSVSYPFGTKRSCWMYRKLHDFLEWLVGLDYVFNILNYWPSSKQYE